MDKTRAGLGPKGADLVTVYKGVERESYSCSPQCAARITLGDVNSYFGSTMAQSNARTRRRGRRPPPRRHRRR